MWFIVINKNQKLMGSFNVLKPLLSIWFVAELSESWAFIIVTCSTEWTKFLSFDDQIGTKSHSPEEKSNIHDVEFQKSGTCQHHKKMKYCNQSQTPYEDSGKSGQEEKEISVYSFSFHRNHFLPPVSKYNGNRAIKYPYLRHTCDSVVKNISNSIE